MASRIITKKGSGAPLASDLVHGELAVDTVNKRLYTENAGGTVIEVGTSPSTIDINAGTIDGTVIGGSSAAAITGTTITGTSFVSSGDMTFGDNDKAVFGAGSDLQIYHDGSNSYIDETGSGSIFIRDNDNIALKRQSDNANMLVARAGAEVELYHNGSEKLATTATGIDVTGTVTADGLVVDSAGSISSGSSAGSLTLFGGATNQGGKIVLDGGNNDGDIVFHAEQSQASPKKRMLIASNGDISFYEDTGTTAKFFWDASAESLGIGTSAPANLLHLKDEGYQLKIEDTSSGNTGEVLVSDTSLYFFSDRSNAKASSDIRFSVDNSEAMRIDSSGNVGIGVTNVGATLDVGSANPKIRLTDTGGGYSELRGNGGVITLTADAGNTVANSAVTFETDGTERMRIDSSGNVGIGTTANQLGERVNVTGAGILVQSSAGSNRGLIGNFGGSDFVVGTYDSFPMVFRTGNAERMRIDSSGNVLINNSTGAGGTPPNSGFVLETGGNIKFRVSSNGSAASQYYNASGTIVGSVVVNATTTAYNTSSDQRLKDNIVDAPAGNVDDIKVRSFDWKADGSHQDYGMVAQELEAVAPYAVTKGQTEDDMWSVDYSKLVPMLIKEIQDLKAEVAALKGAN